jgi:membrane associated rhomboid family serine protease
LRSGQDARFPDKLEASSAFVAQFRLRFACAERYAPLIKRMFGVTTSDENQPVAWVGRYPIDITTLLVAAHVTCMVLTCFLIALGGGAVLNLLQFDSAQVLHQGAVWQLVTYAFVHSPSSLIWFAIEMYMLFVFGREVERFIGRRAYVALYLVLLLGPSLLLTVWGLGQRNGLAGSTALHFGIFIAFATIYPRVEMFLRITARWVALILAGVYTLQLLAYHVWSEMAVLWLSIGAALLFIRLRGIGPELVWWNNFKTLLRPKPKFEVVPRASARRVVEPDNIHESIDPVLDKISKLGIGSLTASERRALDRARNRLLKKSK